MVYLNQEELDSKIMTLEVLAQSTDFQKIDKHERNLIKLFSEIQDRVNWDILFQMKNIPDSFAAYYVDKLKRCF